MEVLACGVVLVPLVVVEPAVPVELWGEVYGSKLYVESVDGSIVYGYCTAVDTGGFCDDGSAIIDVFYDTYDECVNWGRRDVNVYVVAEN